MLLKFYLAAVLLTGGLDLGLAQTDPPPEDCIPGGPVTCPTPPSPTTPTIRTNPSTPPCLGDICTTTMEPETTSEEPETTSEAAEMTTQSNGCRENIQQLAVCQRDLVEEFVMNTTATCQGDHCAARQCVHDVLKSLRNTEHCFLVNSVICKQRKKLRKLGKGPCCGYRGRKRRRGRRGKRGSGNGQGNKPDFRSIFKMRRQDECKSQIDKPRCKPEYKDRFTKMCNCIDNTDLDDVMKRMRDCYKDTNVVEPKEACTFRQRYLKAAAKCRWQRNKPGNTEGKTVMTVCHVAHVFFLHISGFDF